MDAIPHLAAAVDAAFETRAELTPERARPDPLSLLTDWTG